MAESPQTSTTPIIERSGGHTALRATTDRAPAGLPHLRHLRHLRILVGTLRRLRSPDGTVRYLWIAALIVGALWQRWGPVTERPVPPSALVTQWDARTCGPAAVATLLNLYGQPWTRQALARECRVGAAGASMFDLRECCRRHGLAAQGLQAGSPAALRRVPRPFVAYVCPAAAGADSGHFVVVRAWLGDEFWVFDPTSGWTMNWTPEQLYARGQGQVLAVDAGGCSLLTGIVSLITIGLVIACGLPLVGVALAETIQGKKARDDARDA